MTTSTTQEFGKWRSRLWPIHAYELKKFLPMLMMFFLISFNYTVLRDTKDSIIVPSCGAGAIPFLKVYGTVPFAIIFMLIYSKLSNVLSKPKLFTATIVPFMVFFGVFAYVLYPMRHIIHPSGSAEWLMNALPERLSVIASLYHNWSYALFYVLAELYGSVVLSLLFWGFANDITRVAEAKRFYAPFGLGANLALLVSGECIKHFSYIAKHLPEEEAWGVALNWLMGFVVVNCFLTILIYGWMQRNVMTDPRFYAPEEAVASKKSKPKMKLTESFAYLAKSPYMLLLAALVVGYGICINLIEVSWKGQLHLQFPDHTDYSRFMGTFSQVTGLMTCFMILCVSGNVIRRFGWTTAALFTPVVLGITGLGFFGGLFAKENLIGFASALGTTPLFLVVLFGTAQNILSKSTKYSLFDPTKEMAYIPLDQEQKVKGKAAIDVVGARLGKSGGSLIQQVLIATVGFAGMMPYVAAMVAFTIILWIICANALGKRFTTLQAQREAVAVAAASTSSVERPAPAKA
jgi:ATP:ADP antiporter, AAA family